MPQQLYALEPGGPKQLQIAWRGNWKELAVALDGQPIGESSDPQALKRGLDFALPDGSTLHVQLIQRFYAAELQILRDGRPLPGSSTDPREQLRNAVIMVWFIAGLNLVLGLLAVALRSPFFQEMGIGVGSLVFGAVYLGLGFWVRRPSALALWLAILLFAGDGVLGFVLAIGAGVTPSVAGLLARVFLLIPMVRGLGAIKALRQPDPLA